MSSGSFKSLLYPEPEILDQRLTGEQIRKVLKEVPSGEHLHYKVLQNLNQEN